MSVVRDRLRALLRERGASALVSSAACGADLIGQDVGRELALRRIIVLPYPVGVFRERSVADRPGDWGMLYDEIIAGLERGSGELVQLNASEDTGASQQAFMATNAAILERAEELAQEAGDGGRILAIALWDGASRGPDDLTDHFRRAAVARGASVAEVLTSTA